jgi:hypothetical protein
MKFEYKKTENCFADSQTFEYKLPVDSHTFIGFLGSWELKENYKYRRPMFTAEKNGVNLKGVLKSNVIKASFPGENWAAEKQRFEDWLGMIVD